MARTAELDFEPKQSSSRDCSLYHWFQLLLQERFQDRTGFRNVTPGHQDFAKLVSRVRNARESERFFSGFHGPPKQAPGLRASQQATLGTHTICPQSQSQILHSTARPAPLKIPSHAESSEQPGPNGKRRNSVDQAVTLGLNWNYFPKGPLQSLLINGVAHAKKQFKLSPSRTAGAYCQFELQII